MLPAGRRLVRRPVFMSQNRLPIHNPCSPDADSSTFAPAPTTHTAEDTMAKSLDKKKEDKKKPEKSLKEKRAAKKDKKAGK